MTKQKSLIELKREYFSQEHLYFTPKMIDVMVEHYGDKPATIGEAIYVIKQRLLDILVLIPFISRLMESK